MIKNLHLGLRHLARTGTVTAPAREAKPLQGLQVKINDFETNEISSAQLFGFASSPLPGSDVVLLNLGGNNSKAIAIASNDPRCRPLNLGGGETKVYDSAGQFVYLQGGVKIIVSATNEVTITSSQKVTVTSPNVYINGNITVTGNITVSGDVTASGKSLAHHTHGGVQVGGGTTGQPS